MNDRAARTRTDPAAPERAWGRDASRLLAMLKRDRDTGVTVAAMRERGIDAPAQAIYTLQLVGYAIDRVPTGLNRRAAPAYRLRAGARSLNGRSSDAGHGDEL
jgi:hypothetical protein